MPKKIDASQPLIVRELRRAGCFVQSLAEVGHGVPDLLVARAGRWYLMECKDGNQPPSKQRLTPDEEEWHQLSGLTGAKVHIVKTPEDALKAVGL